MTPSPNRTTSGETLSNSNNNNNKSNNNKSNNNKGNKSNKSSSSSSSNNSDSDSDRLWLITIEVGEEDPRNERGSCAGGGTTFAFWSEPDRDRFLAAARAECGCHLRGYSVRTLRACDCFRGIGGSESKAGVDVGARKNDASSSSSSSSLGFLTNDNALCNNQNENEIEIENEVNQKIHEQHCASIDEHSPAFNALVKRFELFRRVVEHEDDLLNQRMSWIILAQSFLMAAFISSSSSSNSSISSDFVDDAAAKQYRRLLYGTAVVGLLTCLVTLPALVAAGKNIEVQQGIYFAGLPSDALCRRLHGHDRDRSGSVSESERGFVRGRSRSRPRPSHHLLPNTAFRSRFGVPILTTVVLLTAVQVLGWCWLLLAISVP